MGSTPITNVSEVSPSRSAWTVPYQYIRAIIVIAALVILLIRSPITFHAPQMWGEDADFYYLSNVLGWKSIEIPLSGYYAYAQFVIAIITSYFPVRFGALIYCYVAIAITLHVVWLVTSPRLDLPFKPLLALSVVTTPMMNEIVGTLVNIQWLLPLGAFAMLFMRAPRSKVILMGEAVYAAAFAFSGPFSIFLGPLYLTKIILTKSPRDRQRLSILLLVIAAGAALQITALWRGRASGVLEKAVYPWMLLFNLPFAQIMKSVGLGFAFRGYHGVALALLCILAASATALCRPYRTAKIFMCLFGGVITISGIYLANVTFDMLGATTRYFYASSIFMIWIILCASNVPSVRRSLVGLLALVNLGLIFAVANTPRDNRDFAWPTWGRYSLSGIPINIPTTPGGFYVDLPAGNGPYSLYDSWIGHPINAMTTIADPSRCEGAMELPIALPLTHIASITLPAAYVASIKPSTQRANMTLVRGTAWDVRADKEAALVAVTGADGSVLGFGVQGFKPNGSGNGPEWRANLQVPPATIAHAYAVLSDSTACPLTGNPAPGPFVGASPIVPGSRIMQTVRVHPGLRALSVQFVTYAQRPSPYDVQWQIEDGARIIASGKLDAVSIGDWERADLPIASVRSGKLTLSLWTNATQNPEHPLAMPRFGSGDGEIVVVPIYK